MEWLVFHLECVAEISFDKSIYHAKTGIARDGLLKMLNEDRWMTGAQAKERGDVDEVTDFKVVVYLGEDKETAFFNGLPVELAKRGGAWPTTVTQ